MITVITGTPGAGKTAYVVSELMKLGATRPVFVEGIPDLKVTHLPAGEAKDWHNWAPAGALVILDECQRHFPIRKMGSEVPPWVSGFETHRHQGLDFWLITQDAGLLDSHVRKLVGKHIHLEANWLGRKLFEWNRVSDPTSRADRQLAASRDYKLPKKAFSQYRSAEVHTKQTRRIPKAAFIILGAVLLVPVLGYRLWSSVGNRLNPPASQGLATAGGPGPAQPARPSQGATPPAVPGESLADWIPRIQHMPETAPVYDGVRKIVAMPVIAGCVASADRCSCYTDQATRVYLDKRQCRDHLESPPFNPYKLAKAEMPESPIPMSEMSDRPPDVKAVP